MPAPAPSASRSACRTPDLRRARGPRRRPRHDRQRPVRPVTGAVHHPARRGVAGPGLPPRTGRATARAAPRPAGPGQLGAAVLLPGDRLRPHRAPRPAEAARRLPAPGGRDHRAHRGQDPAAGHRRGRTPPAGAGHGDHGPGRGRARPRARRRSGARPSRPRQHRGRRPRPGRGDRSRSAAGRSRRRPPRRRLRPDRRPRGAPVGPAADRCRRHPAGPRRRRRARHQCPVGTEVAGRRRPRPGRGAPTRRCRRLAAGAALRGHRPGGAAPRPTGSCAPNAGGSSPRWRSS